MFSWSQLNILHLRSMCHLWLTSSSNFLVLLWQSARPNERIWNSHVIPEMIGSQKIIEIHKWWSSVVSLWLPSLCSFLWSHVHGLGKVQATDGRSRCQKTGLASASFLASFQWIANACLASWIESSNFAICGLFSSWGQSFSLEKTAGYTGLLLMGIPFQDKLPRWQPKGLQVLKKTDF